jgi:steroid delta-isomerase-like uncharacterized protein
MKINSNKEIVLRLIDEVWNKGNMDVVDELISPSYALKNDPGEPFNGKSIDRAAFEERVKVARTVFPDLRFDIKEIISEGDKVVISWFMLGTQKGDIPQVKAADQKINTSGLTIYYLDNGKITGHWQVLDRLTMIEQMSMTKK